MLVLVLTIIWFLVAIRFSFELFWGAYNIEMHMVWHENLEKVNVNVLGGALGKEYCCRFQWFGN